MGATAATGHRRDVALTVLDAGYTIALTACLGQTLGQRLMGIRVVDARSWERPPWTGSAIHWAVGGLAYPLTALLPPLGSMLRREQQTGDEHRLGSERRHGLHDEELMGLDGQNRASAFAGWLRMILSKALGAVDSGWPSAILTLRTRRPRCTNGRH